MQQLDIFRVFVCLFVCLFFKRGCFCEFGKALLSLFCEICVCVCACV